MLLNVPSRIETAKKTSTRTLAAWVGLLVLYADVLSGVLRFGFAAMGVPALSYAPFLLVFVFMGGRALVPRGEGAARLRFWAIVACFGIPALVGIMNGLAPMQIGFAFYTWAPFFIGMLVMVEGQQDRILKHALWLWLIPVLGVVLNRFIEFPWTGGEIEVFGLNVSAARDWESAGVQRLPGFSRASYTAAAHICLFGAVLMGRYERVLKRVMVLAVSLVALAITTSKTPMIAMVAAFLFVTGGGWLPGVRKSTTGQARLILITALVLLGIVVAAPLYFLGASGADTLDMTQGGALLRMDSLAARMTQMWPDAFKMMARDGHGLVWIFGRGLGGIGAGQMFESNAWFNAADNLFVFLYASFGLMAAAWGAWFLQGVARLKQVSFQRQREWAAPLIALLVLALTSNLVESVHPLFFWGMFSAMGRARKASL